MTSREEVRLRTAKEMLPPKFSSPLVSELSKVTRATEQGQDSSFTSLPVREEMMAKYSNLSLESHNISLTVVGCLYERMNRLFKRDADESSSPVEKNITLEKPSDLELLCQFAPSGDLNSVNVTWKKDDELLENIDVFNTTKVGNTLYSQYSKQMGNYSCFFDGEKNLRGTFNIKVPGVHGKNKPLITYVGDSTILKCECHDGHPLNWTWYTSNGSVQVPIDVHKNDKYVINGSYANETRLKVKHLLEEDGGSYWCRAAFQLGESEEHIELVVLSFMVPLKPFLAIIAEVILLVAIILLCEVYTQKKKNDPDDGKEFEQIEQLKSDDSNGIENNAPRLRKNESVEQ
ncbi:hypothetical protein ACRRTK_020086 [Alexandromys fortis]